MKNALDMQLMAIQQRNEASSARAPLATVLLLIAFFILVTTVALSPPEFIYDEPDYMQYVALLRQYGLTEEFLVALTGGAGPLYAFVHHAFEPLTQLNAVRMRLVNVVLLAVVAGILAAWLRRQNRADYLPASCAILAVPMTWVLAGMALTSMPALVFVSLSLYLLLRGVEALEREGRVLVWFAAAGLSLGIAVWGRQTALVLTAVPVVLALLDRRLRIPATVFAAIVMFFTAPLVLAWEGFAPPGEAAEEGLSLRHGLASLGYTGLCFFLLAPGRVWLSSGPLVIVATLAAMANAVLGIVVKCPFSSLLDDYLSASGMAACAVLFGSFLVFCAVLFIAWISKIIWRERRDLARVAINAGLLCIALSPALIANFYSSRYTAMALPYLVLAAQPWRSWNLKMCGAAILGCGAGWLSLLGYFQEP